MSPYTWGLVLACVVGGVAGVFLAARLERGRRRSLRTRRTEELAREAFAWNARRRVRAVLCRASGARFTLDCVELAKLQEYVLDTSSAGDPFGAADRRVQVAPGDVVRFELAGVTDVEPVALLGYVEAIGGAA